MLKQRIRLRRLAVPLGALAAGLLALALAGPASAQSAHGAESPQDVTYTDATGQVITVHALTAAEVRAKGLDRYVDMSRYRAVAPKIVPQPSVAAKRSATPASVAPLDTCWSSTFGYGRFSWPQLWGRTDVSWCGDGHWVRYASSNCYGYSNYPTYNYIGCSNHPDYGAGWNLYQVNTHWSLCPVWVPLWGTCAVADNPWRQYQYFGDGGILYNGGGG